MMKKEGLFILVSFVVLGIMTTYSNCGLQITPDGSKQNLSGQSTSNADQSITESWNQQSVKPEIVFVVDTSGSMTSKVPTIVSSIQGWLDTLEANNVDELCLGVMKAHTDPASSGLLVAKPGNNLCYCTFGPNAVSQADAIAGFVENINEALIATTGGGNQEYTIGSMTEALTNPTKLQLHQDAGCFRPDTSLVPMLISDENDVCSAIDDGANVFNNDHLIGVGNSFSSVRGDALYNSSNAGEIAWEATVRKEYCAKKADGTFDTDTNGKFINQISFETLVQEVQNFNQSMPSFGGAMGFKVDNLPPGPTNGYPFWGGSNFAQSYGYPMVDLRDALESNVSGFQASMNNMGTALAGNIQYYNMFDLQEAICDTDQDGVFEDESLSVKHNGNLMDPVQYAISSDGQKITFDPSVNWAPEDAIEMTYFPCSSI